MPERISPQQRETEPFRWCIHCDADCEAPDVEHADWCPSSNGVFPVRVMWHCGHCMRGFEEARIDPYCCSNCEEPFKRGDSYVLQPLADMGDDVFTPFCLGCAVGVEADHA